MFLKVFVLLRVPISIFALLGFAAAFPDLGAWFSLGAYVYLGFVSVQLWRAKPGALKLAGLLLAVETVGGVLFVLATDIVTGRVDALGAVLIAAGVVAWWTLPNSLCLYLLRGRFVVVPETQRLPPIEARETRRFEVKK